MVQFSPFQPLRPQVTNAAEVSSAAFEKPEHGDYPNIPPTPEYSFQHVINPDYFTKKPLSAIEKRKEGRENLVKMISKGFLCEEPNSAFYVYRQICGKKEYTGIIGTVNIGDYEKGHVRKHELTHEQKEATLTNFFREVGVNGSPVLLTHPESHDLDAFMRNIMLGPALYNFTSKDGIQHAVWRVTKSSELAYIQGLFATLPNLYIADGHHRCAASARFLKENDGNNEGFMACCLPADQLDIFGYHRLLSHLNGLTTEEFLQKAETYFDIKPLNEKRFPKQMGELVFLAEGQYWGLYPKVSILDKTSYKAQLDVYLVEEYLIKKILNPCNDEAPELVYTEGTMTLPRLEQKMQQDELQVAFLLHPISVQYLMQLSDNGETLPPKSTWIEPKMRSGLFIHQLK